MFENRVNWYHQLKNVDFSVVNEHKQRQEGLLGVGTLYGDIGE